MTQFQDRGPGGEQTGGATSSTPGTGRTGGWTKRPTATVARATTAVPPPPTGNLADLGDLPVPSRWLSLRGLKRLIRLACVALMAMFAFITLQIIVYRWITPPTSTLMLWQKFNGTRIERTWRPLERISHNLARAVLMSEDAGFCSHRGVDWKELERVVEQSLDGEAAGGGSTLSMQVIKNLFLWPSKSYVRKALEVPLTLAADRWWGKARMLEIYLNIAEWGPGIFGAEAAARAYFKKSALDLSESEAALLAVALPNPLQRNSADPSPLQRRLAATVQTRMKAATRNTRCLVRNNSGS